jgi:ribosomal protein S6
MEQPKANTIYEIKEFNETDYLVTNFNCPAARYRSAITEYQGL